MRRALVWSVVATILVAVLPVFAAKRCKIKCQCRRECPAAIAACVAGGGKRCRMKTLARCGRRGLSVCEVTPPASDTTTTTLPPGRGRYTITDLGTLGGAESEAHALNNFGQVVGVSDTAGPVRRGFLWSGGTLTAIGTLGGPNSEAFDVNDAGQIVGESDGSGFLLSGGVMTSVQVPFTTTVPTRITASGLVVGNYEFNVPGGSLRHAFQYSSSVMDLLPRGKYDPHRTIAYDVNDAGQIVGVGTVDPDTLEGRSHAFLYANGVMTDLGTLAGPQYPTFLSTAFAINNRGEIAGASQDDIQRYHAFLYRNGVMTAIGDFGPAAMNDGGTIVGSALDGSGAVIFENGTVTPLVTLLDADAGWELEGAEDVNESGQICGVGVHGGAQHGYLLTPR